MEKEKKVKKQKNKRKVPLKKQSQSYAGRRQRLSMNSIYSISTRDKNDTVYGLLTYSVQYGACIQTIRHTRDHHICPIAPPSPPSNPTPVWYHSDIHRNLQLWTPDDPSSSPQA